MTGVVFVVVLFVVEEGVEHRPVEGHLGRRDFGPLHFEAGSQAVFGLEATQALVQSPGRRRWAPDPAEDHGPLAVVLEVAGLVAVDVAEWQVGHGSRGFADWR